jgi:hypothetical protein
MACNSSTTKICEHHVRWEIQITNILGFSEQAYVSSRRPRHVGQPTVRKNYNIRLANAKFSDADKKSKFPSREVILRAAVEVLIVIMLLMVAEFISEVVRAHKNFIHQYAHSLSITVHA